MMLHQGHVPEASDLQFNVKLSARAPLTRVISEAVAAAAPPNTQVARSRLPFNKNGETEARALSRGTQPLA